MSDKSESKDDNKGQRSPIYAAFIENESAIKRFIGRFLSRPQDIDDVSQEAFLKAYSAEKVRHIDQPKAYLFRISKNIALTSLSKKSNQITDYIEESVDSQVLLECPSVEGEVEAHQYIGQFCAAAATLPPQCCKAFLLRKVYGLSHKEIAERLDIAVSTVEKHLMLGGRKFSDYMREHTDYDETRGAQRKADTHKQTQEGKK